MNNPSLKSKPASNVSQASRHNTFTSSQPYTVHYLNGSTLLVTNGTDPDFLNLKSWKIGPGQHVHEQNPHVPGGN